MFSIGWSCFDCLWKILPKGLAETWWRRACSMIFRKWKTKLISKSEDCLWWISLIKNFSERNLLNKSLDMIKNIEWIITCSFKKYYYRLIFKSRKNKVTNVVRKNMSWEISLSIMIHWTWSRFFWSHYWGIC